MKNRFTSFFPSLSFSSSFLTTFIPNSYLFLTILSLSLAQVATAQIPSSGLVGYWPFNGNANDESGNGNNGTVNGATLTVDRFGNENSAYYFDYYQEIVTAFNSITGTQSRTFSFWMKNSNGQKTITPIWYGGTNQPQIGASFNILFNRNETLDQCGCWPTIYQGIGVGADWVYLLRQYNTGDNQWHFYTFVLVNSGDSFSQVKIYVDGSLLNSNEIFNYNGNASTVVNTINNNGLIFGRSQANINYPSDTVMRAPTEYLDDISIYNRALTPNEINQIYTDQTSTVQVPCTISIPTVITGEVYACDYLTSGTTTYSTPAVEGSTFEWVAPAGMTIVSGQGTNSITVSFGSAFVTSHLKVRAVNGCGSSAYKFFQVKRLAPATPASLTSATGKACPGDAIVFTAATMPGATSYNWTAPAGATVTAGQGTNIATITFNSGFTAAGVVSVTASNGCGTSVAKTKTISLNMPLTPSVITGTRTVSQNQTAVPYSVVNVAGMTYNWTVASNFGTVASGQGNNAITVNATNIIGTGYTMSVTATNSCGTSPVRAIANLKIVAGASALELAETPASELEKTDLVSIANVSIFPNPASDFVTLQLENIEEGTVAQVTIFDLTGKQVFNMQSTSNLQTIDVSQFAKGMYVIHVNTATENFVQKLQVK